MHDPMTVAHEIKRPWRQKPDKFFPKGYRPTLVTIWHVDPESDGSDDSCGWFKRARHGDQETLDKIRRAFLSEWEGEHIGWFDTHGYPVQSIQATTLAMFQRAAYIHFGDSWPRVNRFLAKHLLGIILFSENNIDSLRDFLVQKYGIAPKEQRAARAAETIYGCILRWTQPWYRHARWHVWHWRVEVAATQALKRWLFSRCLVCGKGFSWGYAPCSGWDGDGPRWFRGERGVYHHECDRGSRMNKQGAA